MIYPDVEQGQIETEALNGIGLGSVEDGKERSVHELAIGYVVKDIWKVTAAVEVAERTCAGAGSRRTVRVVLMPVIRCLPSR